MSQQSKKSEKEPKRSHFFVECLKHKGPCSIRFPGLELLKHNDGQLILHYRPSYSITASAAENRFANFQPSHTFIMTPITGQAYKKIFKFVESREEEQITRKKQCLKRSSSRSRTRSKSPRTDRNQSRSLKSQSDATRRGQGTLSQRMEYLEKCIHSIFSRQGEDDEKAKVNKDKMEAFCEKIEAYGEEIELCKEELIVHSKQIKLSMEEISRVKKDAEGIRQKAKEHKMAIVKQEEELRRMQEDIQATLARDEEESQNEQEDSPMKHYQDNQLSNAQDEVSEEDWSDGNQEEQEEIEETRKGFMKDRLKRSVQTMKKKTVNAELKKSTPVLKGLPSNPRFWNFF